MSSNNADGLPSYKQVFQMDNIATAPLLDERFPGSIFDTATTLKFEWDSDSDADSSPDKYSFLIRDPVGCLQAQGKVVDQNVTLRNINGLEMLKIFKNNFDELQRTYSNGTTVHTYEVKHNNTHIGSIKFVEKESAANCLKILQKCADCANPQIIVRSLKIGDFAIFRDNLSSTPLCNIQMSDATVFAEREFNGTIVFKPETEITVEEQLLCTAAAIVFKVSMKKITAAANEVDKSNQCIYTAFGLIIFIGIFVIFFFVMEKVGCESKKSRGYAGYRNKEC